MCDAFEYMVKLEDARESRIYGRDIVNSTAKRILDLVRKHPLHACRSFEFGLRGNLLSCDEMRFTPRDRSLFTEGKLVG